jgi:hypothetical protein
MLFLKEYQLFYINSKDRINGHNSNFTIKLDHINKNTNFTHVAVLQAVIPKTYYLVSTNNNTFILQEGDVQVTIQIPIGNYSKPSFKNIIPALMNANSPGGFIYQIRDDNILVGPDTGKFTYSVSNNAGIQPTLIMNSEVSEQFGFATNSSNSFINNNLVSTQFINFSLENIIYVHSNICQNTTSDNILQEIYTTGIPTSSYIKYDCQQLEAYAKPFNSKSDVYQFYLTNEDDVYLDLNGVNLEITIIVFEKNNIDAEIKNYIDIMKMKNQLKLMHKN